MSRLRFPPIAVVDVETTGLFPFRRDRVIEVAAVVIDDRGAVCREFVSLVNPLRDVGPVSVHGLSASDVLHAPCFPEVAGAFLQAIDGVVALAAHNVRFDRLFLEHEFLRMQVRLPSCKSLCTMQLAGGGRLDNCCSAYGVDFCGERHSALSDARAAAHLLIRVLADRSDILESVNALTPVAWPPIPLSGKPPLCRDEARSRLQQQEPILGRLRSKMNSRAQSKEEGGMAYRAVLDRALEDRCVSETEVNDLLLTATSFGLSPEQAQLVHDDYMADLASAIVADGIVTEAEKLELHQVARLLGYEECLDRLLSQASEAGGVLNSNDFQLAGLQVCFTGELRCSYHGKLISREVAEQLAEQAGLEVAQSVTKKLDLLVVADPSTQSGKAKKARQYGTRILHEVVFWRALGVEVTDGVAAQID